MYRSFISVLRLLRNKGMDLDAYCRMTRHIHMIIGTHQDDMEDIMRQINTHTSKELKKAIREHPVEGSSMADFLYNNARNYYGMKGMIGVVLPDPILRQE